MVTTTPITCGRLGSGSGGGVVGSMGGTDCGRVAGSGGSVGGGGGANSSRVAGSVGAVGRGGSAHCGIEYVLDVMGAWLDIDISRMGGGVCKGGVHAFRMWWCALRMIMFPIWTS